MIFNIISDLHCEFWRDKRLLEHRPNMIIAGDIAPFQSHDFGFRENAIVQVAGNHEYYGTRLHNWRQMPGTSVFGGVRFIYATLWSSMTPSEALVISQLMNDYHTIKIKDSEPNSHLRQLTPDDTNAMHVEELAYIRQEVDTPFDGPTVVVTHFMPRLDLIHPRHDSACNAGFATNVDHSGVDVWIYGHTHDPMDKVIDGTRFICNPYGYYRHDHYGKNDPWFELEIGR